MNTGNVAKEQVSSLADGELDEGELDAVLAALRHSDKREDWDLYHQIGDVMRSDDMDVSLSSDFSARMAARLEAEPTILAPVALQNKAADNEKNETAALAKKSVRRFAIPGLAAVAAAFAAFVAAPQLMLTAKTDNQQTQASSMIASASAVAQEASAAGSGQEEVVLRDAQIDEYLMAHQRFSPSLYSTAQFARSATFTTESDK